MPVDRFVFPPRLRRFGVLYVAATVPLCGALSWSVAGQHDHIRALLAAGSVYALPVLVLAGVAAVRAAPGDRLVWRLWALGAASSAVSAYVYWARAARGWEGFETWSAPRSVAAMGILIAANTLILRRRSGARAALVDAIDLLMATIAVVVPLAMVWGDDVVESPHSWAAVTASVWLIGSFHGLFVALAIRSRIRADDRISANVGIALGVTGVAAAAAGTHHAVQGFPAPGGPFVALHAAMLGMVLLFFLHSTSRSSVGLERLPAAGQVRRRSIVVVGVMSAVPVIGVLAWLGRDERWVVATAAAAAGALLLLSGVRHLLSARETARLYAQVEEAAIERGELLAEVMAHVDAERHRVAAHLHREAVALYTAMATVSCALERAARDGTPAAATDAAQRLRRDLGRRADGLRRVALAVKPLSPLDEPAQGLATTIRAYVENLWADGRRPDLDVAVDHDLELDWATEAIVVRILQEAIHNVRRHADAATLSVVVRAGDGAIRVEVADDGVGTTGADEGRGIATMRSMAGFLGGTLAVEPAPAGGTLVRAEIGIHPTASPPPTRPSLSVVR